MLLQSLPLPAGEPLVHPMCNVKCVHRSFPVSPLAAVILWGCGKLSSRADAHICAPLLQSEEDKQLQDELEMLVERLGVSSLFPPRACTCLPSSPVSLHHAAHPAFRSILECVSIILSVMELPSTKPFEWGKWRLDVLLSVRAGPPLADAPGAV